MEDQKRHYPDGDYSIADIVDCLDKDFHSEKELCSYIDSHIIEFCRDCLNVEYSSHAREYPLSEIYTRRHKGNKRIDFLIITKDNQRIGIECKHPKTPSELQEAIGQTLSYLTLFEMHGRPLTSIWILSTKLDTTISFTIEKFSLPIGFMLFDKTKFLTYKNGSTKRKSVLETEK